MRLKSRITRGNSATVSQSLSGCIPPDRQITYEMLAECCLIKPLRAHQDFSIPGEDEITRGVIEMLAD